MKITRQMNQQDKKTTTRSEMRAMVSESSALRDTQYYVLCYLLSVYEAF